MFSFAPARFSRNATVPGIPGRMSNIPSSMATLNRTLMNGTAKFSAGTYNAANQSNSFVNHSYRIIPSDKDPGRDMLDNLDYGMPHFVHVPENIINKYSARLQANLSDMPQEMRSLSSLNHWLKSEPGRLEFGGDKDAKRLFATYKLKGSLQTQPTADTRIRNELKATLTVAKRVRMPDFFAATGRLINAGDYLYLIAVRRSLDEGKEEFKEEPEKENEIPRTYWQVQPWIAPPGMQPPAEAYITQEFIGDKWYLGKVFTVETPVMDIDTHKSMARRAIFPEHSEPNIHRKDISALPQFEMQESIR